MGLFGGLIGAAAGLVGGFLDREDNKDARRKADYNNSPQGIRDRAEAAGFNPLVFAGPGTGTGAQYAPTMGSSLATTLSLAAESYTDAQRLELQKSELELEKQRLEKLVKATTLTPKVPGVYGNGVADRKGGVDPVRNSDSDKSAFPSVSASLTPPPRDKYNLYVDVFDPETGRWISIPNPDLIDIGPTEATYSLAALGAADVLQNGLGLGGVGGATRAARKQGQKSRPPARSYTDPVPYHPIWGYASPRSISPTQAEMDQHRYRMNVLTGN